MYDINEKTKYMECIKCFSTYEINDYFMGCPSCLNKGEPSSISFKYQDFKIEQNKVGLNRYLNMLPLRDFPTIGEGNTPTIQLKNLCSELGLKHLWIKNEGQNPTGSHKDRMSPFIMPNQLE